MRIRQPKLPDRDTTRTSLLSENLQSNEERNIHVEDMLQPQFRYTAGAVLACWLCE
jgi:hypothetical protein